MTSALDPAVARPALDAAAALIAPFVRHTPVVELDGAELGVAGTVVLKLELLQVTGSFKARGAFHRVLRARDAGQIPGAGIIAASGGNHGAAVAHVAAALGMPAEVFVPELSPEPKRARIRASGATVVVAGAQYDDAQTASERRAAETGAFMVHPYDHLHTVAGAATCGRELDLDAGHVDRVLVAVGGGGLAAGVAAWYAGSAPVITVEPEGSACFAAARRAGHPVPVVVDSLAADSLGARQVGAAPWSVLSRAGFVADAVTVPDSAIRAAQRWLWSALRLVAEPGGAAALAALVSGTVVPAAGGRTAVVVCGSNAEPSTVIGD